VNTYAFFAMYANIDGYTGREQAVPVAERPEIDRWVLSALSSLVGDYRQAMEAYDITKAARMVSAFTIDQLSNWYVRRNRRRFWKGEPGKDKTAAYQTLEACLVTVAKLAAPFAPFLMDELYRNLNGTTGREPAESVHLAAMPAADPAVIDAALEAKMERAEQIVTLVRALRTKANLKVRQPLRRLLLPMPAEADRAAVRQVQDVILDEVNVKALEFADDDAAFVSRSAKPNFKTLGPKFGKKVQQVSNAVRAMRPAEIARLERSGSVTLPVDGEQCAIAPEDVEIVRHEVEGWAVESDGQLTVALDTTLDDRLRAEGFAREFVNRVQNMRKDAGFAVTDRIALTFETSADAAGRLAALRETIMAETLAVEFQPELLPGGHRSTLDVNGERIDVAIERRAHG
jgi:isoleucyl-tRNA synthetase